MADVTPLSRLTPVRALVRARILSTRISGRLADRSIEDHYGNEPVSEADMVAGFVAAREDARTLLECLELLAQGEG